MNLFRRKFQILQCGQRPPMKVVCVCVYTHLYSSLPASNSVNCMYVFIKNSAYIYIMYLSTYPVQKWHPGRQLHYLLVRFISGFYIVGRLIEQVHLTWNLEREEQIVSVNQSNRSWNAFEPIKIIYVKACITQLSIPNNLICFSVAAYSHTICWQIKVMMNKKCL